jgi:hypothetical protein
MVSARYSGSMWVTRVGGVVGHKKWLKISFIIQCDMAGAGGAEGNRTPDLLNAIQALAQLSYGPDR